MAKTIGQAQAKWERKTANAGENWKRGVAGSGGRYSRGIQDFLGAAPSGHVVSAWEAGTGAVSAADFQAAVGGKGSKWAENYRRAMAGG